jgi:hypothetical protein
MPERDKSAETVFAQPGNSVRSESQEEYFGLTETRHPEETPVERSPHRTTLPPEKVIVSGADSMRAVIDNIDHNIAECQDEIGKLTDRLNRLSVQLEYYKKLRSVSEEYKKQIEGKK